jgi:hypothetical protein
MDSFYDALRRPLTLGRPCLGYTDSQFGQISDKTSIQRQRHLLAAGGQWRGEACASSLYNAGGARCAVALELCADDLPRDAIELAAARDALLIG